MMRELFGTKKILADFFLGGKNSGEKKIMKKKNLAVGRLPFAGGRWQVTGGSW